MEATKPLVGFALAKAAHEYRRRDDPDAIGVPVAKIVEGVRSQGATIGGRHSGRTLHSAMNSAKDHFDWVSSGRFRWK